MGAGHQLGISTVLLMFPRYHYQLIFVRDFYSYTRISVLLKVLHKQKLVVGQRDRFSTFRIIFSNFILSRVDKDF